jgi:transposase InsO family protein
MRGSKHADVAVAFGVSLAVVQKFMSLFERGGVDALRLRVSGAGAGAVAQKRAAKSNVSTEVVAARAANPDWGTRRIRDVLARFEGLGVSETTVRRILHEAGLIAEREAVVSRDKPERRFERAEPNQLWQSDIFTFELRRHQRVYLVGFMDDYSRYLVSWAMAHHQKSSLVIEALERGIAEYGEPREVLTDQGRQYAAWRGTTEFQELLRRHGIAHSKSRPQHPETLGKIERFWKTLWEEFLRKIVFADFADCLRRLEHFVKHYNFQRPHQGIDGSVPADRFFRAAPQVRAAIESQIQGNALRLAQEKPAQKPFYLVGRLGDQDLSIAAAGGALRVQVGDASQTIPMNKEQDDEAKATRAFPVDDESSAPTRTSEPQADREAARAAAPAAATQHRQGASPQASSLTEEAGHEAQPNAEGVVHDEIASPTQAAPAWRAALADWAQGSRPSRSAPNAADLVGALGAHAGDNGDRGVRDFASAVLPARDEGIARDDARTGAWRERSVEPRRRDADAADRRAREQTGPARAGEPPPGTPAAAREESPADGTGGISATARSETGPAIDDRWARTFAWLEEAGDESAGSDFDPDDGWRERAVTWTRKLAGADALIDGKTYGETSWPKRTLDVPLAAGNPHDPAAALQPRPSSDRRADDDERSSTRAGDRAREHAELGAPSGSSDTERDGTSTDGADAQIRGAEAARSADREARARERSTEESAASGRRHDGGSRRDHPCSSRNATDEDVEDLFSALTALVDDDERRRRGSVAGDDTVDADASAGLADDEG